MSIQGEPETKKEPPIRWIAILYGMGFGLVALIGFGLSVGIDWREAKFRFQLWQAGAHPVLWEKYRGFTQDRCGGRPPAECECVWLIHGMGDSVTTWRNLFLAPGAFGPRPVRVFAIDLPGHGGSLKRHNVSEYRVTNMAHELDAEIARTKACSVNALVGNSFGGFVAARMALESPKHYAHLILIGSSGLAESELAYHDLFKDGTVEGLKEFQRRAYFKPRVLTDREWAAAATRMKGSAVSEIRSAQVVEDLLDGKLGMISIPTLVIWGEGDQIISRKAMRRFVREIPHAVFVTLPECGHLPQKECPAKFFPALEKGLAL